MARIRFALALLALALGGAVACDKASPVAPTGTVLTISANPSTIPTNGTAKVTISARRANGLPVATGTLINLTTSLGQIDSSVTTDDQGIATATLRGDGRAGTAKVKAIAGASEGAEVEVTVGSPAASISILATPSNVPDSGGQIQLRALVRDDKGQPQPGAQVNFQTEVGTLTSAGHVVTTDANGEAFDLLTVTASQLSTWSKESFEVTAQVGGATGTLQEATATITVGNPAGSLTFQANPTNLPSTGGTVNLLALVRNSQGRPVQNARVNFVTSLGRLNSGGQAVYTNADGEARDKLTVSQSDIAGLNDDSFEVKAQTPGSGGNLVEQSVTIALGTQAASITMQATPSTVSETGGTVSLLAIVRNAQGAPLANAAVNFGTEVGTLASGGSVKTTDANGEVRDTLTVTQNNLAALSEDRFEVSAKVGGANGNLLSATYPIRVQRAKPTASFIAHAAGGNSVFFENTSTGTQPITYFWDFQGDNIIDSQTESPTFNYGNAGTYTVRLRAVNSAGEDVEVQTITVPVP